MEHERHLGAVSKQEAFGRYARAQFLVFAGCYGRAWILRSKRFSVVNDSESLVAPITRDINSEPQPIARFNVLSLDARRYRHLLLFLSYLIIISVNLIKLTVFFCVISLIEIAGSIVQEENRSSQQERKENQSLKKKSNSGKAKSTRNNKVDGWTSPITYEGSSEDIILGARAELLNPILESSRIFDSLSNADLSSSAQHRNGMKNFSEIQEEELLPPFLHRNRSNLEELLDKICQYVISDMDKYGVCVVDRFLGKERGLKVLNEVLNMYSAGLFQDGQLVSNKGSANDLKTIRGDQIIWLDGKEEQCENIGTLISQVDAIIMRANKMHNNGKIGDYTITGRTKVSIYFFLHNIKRSEKTVCFSLSNIIEIAQKLLILLARNLNVIF